MRALQGRPQVANAAFTLIEIVLALGIISFALVGIIGLLPAAMDAATNSQQETQAAFVAHTLYNEMASLPGATVSVASSPSYYDNPASGAKITIDLKTPNKYYLAYNSNGMPVKELDAGAFASGNSEADYLACVTVSTNDLPSGLSRVDVQVDAPGRAKEKSRHAYHFSTLFSQKGSP